jgi:hypothetical protein
MDRKEEDEENKKGFFEYIFNFNRENMENISNMWQYTFIAIPLILICLKILNVLSPEVDEAKGSLEIFIEIFISINVLLLTIWFVNKIVRYIPTRSKTSYHTFNETNFILPFLIILFTIDTKLGNKINILIDRLFDLYNGKTNLNNNNNNKNGKNQQDVKTTQPISRGGQSQQQANNGQQQSNSQFNNLALNNPQFNQRNNNLPETNFNNAFSGPNINNLLQIEEPMAANELLMTRF